MKNKNKPIIQKSRLEINKEVWKLYNPEGKLMGSFRTKRVADEEKERLEYLYLEEFKLKRDNSFNKLK